MDYLLSSKYDPLNVGRGEPGMIPVDDLMSLLTHDSTKSTSTSAWMKNLKRNAEANTSSVENLMKSIISMCQKNNTDSNTEAQTKQKILLWTTSQLIRL